MMMTFFCLFERESVRVRVCVCVHDLGRSQLRE